MSTSFRKIITKWSASEVMRNHKIAVSSTRLVQVHKGILLTVTIFFVIYLMQVNALATKGYTMKELEKRIVSQQKENERLQLEIIERQSMQSIQQKIAELGLVNADRIDYISPTAAIAAATTLSAQ